LAFAALLAAGMEGIEKQIDPGAANHRNLYEVPEEDLVRQGIGFLPTTLSEALDAFERDDLVRGVLGPEYSAEYLRIKREEWRLYNQAVSGWELERYLPIY
jgi:glutamine synthetase